MATTAMVHRRVLSILMWISLCNRQRRPTNSRWQRLFKAVLRDEQAPPFAERKACGRPKKSCPDPLSAVAEHWHARYESAISPMCDRRKPAFNFALNGDRFAPPVGTMYHEGERHDSTHRMGDPWCVTRGKRRPDDRERATGPGARFHCGRPPSDRGTGVGEVANGRMVKRRHLAQRQIYRSDRVHEWGNEQNGGRLANGSASRRQRRR